MKTRSFFCSKKICLRDLMKIYLVLLHKGELYTENATANYNEDYYFHF